MTEQSISNEKMLEEYKNDPENIEKHRKIASVLQQVFPGKWFTAADINRKTAIKSKEEASRLILGLTLFQFCQSRVDRGKTQFRIILTVDDRIEVLMSYRTQHAKQIELLDAEIKKLQKSKEVK